MGPLNWLARLIVYGLAVYRVTNLFVNEDGPGDIFDWIRAKAGIRLVEEPGAYGDARPWEWIPSKSRLVRIANGFWGRLLNCPLCLSVWFSFVAGIALWLESTFCDIVASWLALAGISLVLFGRGEE